MRATQASISLTELHRTVDLMLSSGSLALHSIPHLCKCQQQSSPSAIRFHLTQPSDLLIETRSIEEATRSYFVSEVRQQEGSASLCQPVRQSLSHTDAYHKISLTHRGTYDRIVCVALISLTSAIGAVTEGGNLHFASSTNIRKTYELSSSLLTESVAVFGLFARTCLKAAKVKIPMERAKQPASEASGIYRKVAGSNINHDFALEPA